ncbi:rhomboid family intramembrane serine protease [Chloroflexota bacterium]
MHKRQALAGTSSAVNKIMAYRYQSFKLTPVWVIIAMNFLLFIVTLIAPSLIYSLFGLQPAVFLFKPWTLVTNIFIHASFGHIIANMLTLYFFGTFLSRLIGDKKFLWVYFGGGILGNILFIIISLVTSPFSIAVGASGAIFALCGTLVVLRPQLRVYLFFLIPTPLWLAIIGGFIILSFFPNVAWQAHLGGLIFGLIVGYFFRKRESYY